MRHIIFSTAILFLLFGSAFASPGPLPFWVNGNPPDFNNHQFTNDNPIPIFPGEFTNQNPIFNLSSPTPQFHYNPQGTYCWNCGIVDSSDGNCNGCGAPSNMEVQARRDDGTDYIPDNQSGEATDRAGTSHDPNPYGYNNNPIPDPPGNPSDGIPDPSLWDMGNFKSWLQDQIKRLFRGGGDPYMFCPPMDKDCRLTQDFNVGDKVYRTLSPQWLKHPRDKGWNHPDHPNYKYIEPYLFDAYNNGKKVFRDRKFYGGFKLFLDSNMNDKIDNCYEMLCLPGYDSNQVINLYRDKNGLKIDMNKDGFISPLDTNSYPYFKALDTKTGKVYTLRELNISIKLTGAHRWPNDNPKRIGIYPSTGCYVPDDSYMEDLAAGRIVFYPFPTKGSCFRFKASNAYGIHQYDPETGTTHIGFSYMTIFGVYDNEVSYEKAIVDKYMGVIGTR